jgi:hypothetical protein
MILNRRSHHAGCPPTTGSDVTSEQSADSSPSNSASKGSTSKRVSRIMQMALPSRIAARFFPESSSSSSSSSRKTAATAARYSHISDPILINSTNIAAPIASPYQRPVSMYDARTHRFSSYEDRNAAQQRSSGASGSAGVSHVNNNFF